MALEDIFSKINEKLDVIDNSEKVWREEPVGFVTFVEDKNYLAHPPLTDNQYKDILTFIGEDAKNFFESSDVTGRKYNICVLQYGKRGGKDTIASICNLYVIYILLCLNNVQKYFDLPPGEPVETINVARSGEQATEVYFARLKSKMLNSPWFCDNFKIYISDKVYSNVNTDRVIRISGSGSIVFPNNIVSYSAHSQNESYEGHNLLFWVMDEADAFRDKTGMVANADKVFNTLRTSANTPAFRGRWRGMILSYPRSDSGFIRRMVDEASRVDNIFASTRKTWEVQPSYFYTGEYFDFRGMKIPIEYYNDFLLNPEDSLAKYCCMPPPAEGVFITDQVKIEQIVNKERQSLFDTESVILKQEVKDEMTGSLVIKEFIGKVITNWNVKDWDREKNILRVIHVDLGLTSDAASLMLAHKEPMILSVFENEVLQKQNMIVDKVVVDAIVVWEPDKLNRRAVSVFNIVNFILELKKYLRIVKVTYDRWNSAASLEILMNSGIVTEQYDIGTEDYENLKELIYVGAIDLFYHSKLLEELRKLIRVNNRIDHPVGGSKDIADCLAGVCRMLVNIRQKKELREFRQMPKSIPGVAMLNLSNKNIFRNPDFDNKEVGEVKILDKSQMLSIDTVTKELTDQNFQYQMKNFKFPKSKKL